MIKSFKKELRLASVDELIYEYVKYLLLNDIYNHALIRWKYIEEKKIDEYIFFQKKLASIKQRRARRRAKKDLVFRLCLIKRKRIIVERLCVLLDKLEYKISLVKKELDKKKVSDEDIFLFKNLIITKESVDNG